MPQLVVLRLRIDGALAFAAEITPEGLFLGEVFSREEFVLAPNLVGPDAVSFRDPLAIGQRSVSGADGERA